MSNEDLVKRIKSATSGDDLLRQPGRWTYLWARIRHGYLWPLCGKAHAPYKHWTPEECEQSFMVGNTAYQKRYFCQRRKFHLGKCEDIHGLRFNEGDEHSGDVNRIFLSQTLLHPRNGFIKEEDNNERDC